MGIKYSVNKDFFKKWTPNMAYTLGYIYADGSLENADYLRGRYLRITSTDKDRILFIKKCLESEHTVVKCKNFLKSRKTRYLLRIGDHILYDSLANHGLYPNKSLTIKLPKIPTKYLNSFLLGYFDGDGCVFLEQILGKREKLIIKRLTVIFTSGSNIFLDSLNKLLKSKLKLKGSKVYKGKTACQLRYNTKDSILLFVFMYSNELKSFCLRRKFDIFMKYFQLRPTRINRAIENILLA